MPTGKRSLQNKIAKRETKAYSPSMKAPGEGGIERGHGNENVFGASRHSSKFADAMAPYGGPAKKNKLGNLKSR